MARNLHVLLATTRNWSLCPLHAHLPRVGHHDHAAALSPGAVAIAAVEDRGLADGPDAVMRRAFWMRTARGHRASWLHVPPTRCRTARGAVICAPMGHEYTHSYRTLLHLADRLAEAGLPTIRFDYHGCGSSAGDPFDPKMVSAWIDDIHAAAALIESMTGGPASLIGLRVGATLAGVAASLREVEHFVAWAPVTHGKGYIREQKVLANWGGAGGEPTRGHLDGAGFVLSREAAADLESIDLRTLDYGIRGDALVVERDDLTARSELPARFGDLGVSVDVVVGGGYLAMVEKPHVSVVPDETVGRIVSWLERRARAHPARMYRRSPDTSDLNALGREGANEEMVHVPGPSPLFGILTTPAFEAKPVRPLLLLTNAGSVHSVGPKRLHVEIARRLAAAGFPTLRLDLRNLGDSIRGSRPDENDPYPSTACSDVSRAIDWLAAERGVERVVLGGLCSGAHTAFRCGADLPHSAIGGVLLLNPRTFHRTADDSPLRRWDARYHSSIRDPRKWTKLLRGRYSWRNLPYLAARVARERVFGATVTILERIEIFPRPPLGRDLLRYVEDGRRIDFVFSRFDPGYKLLMTHARGTVRRLEGSGAASLSFIEGADHSFSGRACREALLGVIQERMQRYARNGCPEAERGRGRLVEVGAWPAVPNAEVPRRASRVLGGEGSPR